MPLLWRFNLQYFNYLHLLHPKEQIDLCRSWVAATPLGRGVGWHPYPTSLRIVNWCRADLHESDIQRSLYQQAAYLYRNLETYVYGNHLLENARALVYAGSFFGAAGEAADWLSKGLEIYRSETPHQVPSDGMHFERSPMYHALMLEGYLDVLNLLPADHPDGEWLKATVCRMSDALAPLTHPDGRIALFNDATLEIAADTEALQQYVYRLTGHLPCRRDRLPDAGYYAYRDDDLCLIIDGGAVGPEHLMAHAHADVFSFELSIGGERFFVDTGVFEYPEGPMRTYVRSTKAHNTVCVDDLDQVECWGSFRVARRSAPYDVRFSPRGSSITFEGAFDGYAKLIGDDIVHRRHINLRPRERIIRIEDVVSGNNEHRVESRIHLHPEVEVVSTDPVVLRRGDVNCRMNVIDGKMRWENSVYCPEFGVQLPNKVAVFDGSSRLPTRIAVSIHY